MKVGVSIHIERWEPVMKVDCRCSYPAEYLSMSLFDCAITQPNIFKGGFLYKKKKTN